MLAKCYRFVTILKFIDIFRCFSDFSVFFWPQSRFFERQNLLIRHQQITAFQIAAYADFLSQTAGLGRNRLQKKQLSQQQTALLSFS